MTGVWDTIKATAATAPRDVANADAGIEFDPTRGAPIRVQRTPGLMFRPATLTYEEAIDAADRKIDELMRDVPDDPYAEDLSAMIDLENPNADLVSDDVVRIEIPNNDDLVAMPAPCMDGRGKLARTIKQLTAAQAVKDKAAAKLAAKKPAGRPRVHQTNAQRQKAYRDSKKKKK